MTLKNTYLIQRINSGFPQDYWNRRNGWVSIDDAELFSEHEANQEHRVKLPIGGTWVALRKAIFDIGLGTS